MNIKVRTAAVADIRAMHRIRERVRENRLSAEAGVTEASYLPYIAACTAWVAETEKGIAGFAVLDEPANSVWALFVEPGSEGLGIGRAMHGQLLGWAEEHGIPRLSLITTTGTRAASFYTAAGWLASETTPDGEVRFERAVTT